MCPIDDVEPPIEDEEAGPRAGAAQDGVEAVAGRLISVPPDAGAPISEGTRAWLGEAYEQHRDLVERTLRQGGAGLDWAEDLCHDVFMTLAERGRRRAGPSTAATLVAIARFAVSNHVRRRNRRREAGHEVCADELPASGAGAEELAHEAECERIVAAVLAMMTPSDRTLIELVDLEGHTLAEAANILGRSFEAVKKQHGRALRRFEDLALRYVGDEPPCDE